MKACLLGHRFKYPGIVGYVFGGNKRNIADRHFTKRPGRFHIQNIVFSTKRINNLDAAAGLAICRHNKLTVFECQIAQQ